MTFSKENLISLVKVAAQHNASDIHIRTGESPCLRIRGELHPIQTKDFSRKDILDIARIMIPSCEQSVELDKLEELDGSYEIEGVCRIRFNYFKYNKKYGIILRLVKNQIPSIDTLKFPSIIKEIAERKNGLTLVTGATGSGKSTTLAAMIDHINSSKKVHIVTVEDPIEYLHPQKKSRVSQREIGTDTKDFSVALRAALRQDPDVILIGEMRDAETVQIALKASETGHAVFSTVHTTNAISTINRIISMFPPENQDDVRKRLSNALNATISQRMLKKNTAKGVAIAQEIMITNTGIRECISGKEPLDRIIAIMQEGSGKSGVGSQSFDQHIMQLYENGTISKETALESVSSQSDFITKLELS